MTYNDRGSPEDLCIGANEATRLRGVTHARYIGKHPGLHTKLDGPSKYTSNQLAPKHRPRRNFHVMTKFKVRGKLKGLNHRNVSPGLEHHHSERTTGDSIAHDQFGDDVETDLLVGDSLDHANRDDIEECNQNSQHKTPDREFGWPNLDACDAECEHDHKNAHVPPFRNSAVLGHETCMHIRLFMKGSACLGPDLFAEEQDGVDDCRCDGCERKTICKCKRGRQEQRAVFFVSSEVKLVARCEDPCHIVSGTCIIIRSS